MRNTWLLVCSVAGVVACNASGTKTGDASGGPANQVQGQVNGRAFTAKDSIAMQLRHPNGFSFQGDALFVEITDYDNLCTRAAQHTAPPDSRVLILGVGVNDASSMTTAPTAPGTFTVYSPSSSLPSNANVAQVFYGSGCDKSVAFSGISGTVTVTPLADGSVRGTFDATISCAGFSSCAGPDAHLTGSFAPTSCSSLDVNTIPACMP